MQIITQSFFSSHCSNPEKMELPEPESNTSSRPPGIHQKQQKRGYYQEGVRWCLLKRKWKKTSVLVVNPTTHYSTIILLLLLIPLHSVSFFEFSVQFLIIKAKATYMYIVYVMFIINVVHNFSIQKTLRPESAEIIPLGFPGKFFTDSC